MPHLPPHFKCYAPVYRRLTSGYRKKCPLVCHSLAKWNMKNETLERICKGWDSLLHLDFRKRIHHCPVKSVRAQIFVQFILELRGKTARLGLRPARVHLSSDFTTRRYLTLIKPLQDASRKTNAGSLAPPQDFALNRDNAICAGRPRECKYTHTTRFSAWEEQGTQWNFFPNINTMLTLYSLGTKASG
jgi:hypothetical protein